MQPKDRANFASLLTKVHAFYRQDISDFAMDVWWSAMKPYDFQAVADAFNRHAINPDTGQFCPKPADVVKMLGGTSTDSALVAWSKVDQAVRSVGTYHSVVFDDPLIHKVISDMGGWVKLGSCPSEEDWPFVAKDFQTRYRGFAMRSERPTYPNVLIGMAEAQNTVEGRATQEPRAIGDPEKCKRVYHNGSDKPALTVTPLQITAPLRRIK